MPKNKKQKVKKSRLKARKQKKAVPTKKNKKTLGRRIAVKVIKEPKTENVYGLISEPEEKNSQVIAESQSALLDFDFTENEADTDLGFEAETGEGNNLEILPAEEDESQAEVIETEINEEPAEIEQENYIEDEVDPFNGLSQFQKNLIMYISISCIMLVVVGFWAVGLKASLSQSYSNPADDASLAELQQSFNDFSNNIGQIKNQWEVQQKALEDFSSQAKQKILEEKLKNTIAEDMKVKIANPQEVPAENSNTNSNINSSINSINTNNQ